MAGSLFPFTCPELNVNNTFFVNTTMISFGAKGVSAPVFINTNSMVVNAVGGRVNVNAISIKTSNQSTFFINIDSSGMVLSHPSFTTTLSRNVATSPENSKEYKITSGRIEITNTSGYGFSANLTDVWVGISATPNVAKLTATKLSLRNDNTFISTTGLSINNQATLNVTTLEVNNVVANLVTLETGSQGNANGLSLFSTTANGVAPQTNSKIGSDYVLHANGNWYPPGMMYVTSGNLQGTPASPNVKEAEITWANNFGEIYIDLRILPQTNNQDLRCYLNINGTWYHTGTADYHRSLWTGIPGTGFFNPGGDDSTDFITIMGDVTNNVNKSTFAKITIYERRNSVEAHLMFNCVTGHSISNNLPRLEEGWAGYHAGDMIGANGIMGIRFYFPSGNIASAQWSVRALHRRQT